MAEATLKFEEATRKRMIQEQPRKVALAEKDLAVAESMLTQAETQLRLTTQEVDQETRQARSAVESAGAVATKARENYHRYRKRFEERSAPERKFQDATRDDRMAEADLDAARSKLAKAETERLQVEIAQLGVVQKGRAREYSAEQVRLSRLGELLADEQRRLVDQRRAQLAEASRGAETVRTGLQYTRIVAPFDAVIVRRCRNPGDHGPVGATILSLFDPELVNPLDRRQVSRGGDFLAPLGLGDRLAVLRDPGIQPDRRRLRLVEPQGASRVDGRPRPRPGNGHPGPGQVLIRDRIGRPLRRPDRDRGAGGDAVDPVADIPRAGGHRGAT